MTSQKATDPGPESGPLIREQPGLGGAPPSAQRAGRPLGTGIECQQNIEKLPRQGPGPTLQHTGRQRLLLATGRGGESVTRGSRGWSRDFDRGSRAAMTEDHIKYQSDIIYRADTYCSMRLEKKSTDRKPGVRFPGRPETCFFHQLFFFHFFFFAP